MIDEAMAERLSRYLDGDLSPGDTAELEALLLSDAELAAELEGLRRLQGAVRLVADGMEPPRALESLMAPLRSGEPHAPRRLHPAVRWLGMAAGVVLAVTVAMEVSRRDPGPAPVRPPVATGPTADAEEREIFQLQPLPTSPVPVEEQLVGATERLLASPPAEPVPDEPEPLVVQGPLPVAPEKKDHRVDADAASSRMRNETGREAGEGPARREKSAVAEAPSAATIDGADKAAAVSPSVRPAGAAVLVGSDGVTVKVLDVTLDEAALPVEVEVSQGVIIAVHPVTSGADLHPASDQLIGHAVPKVKDGRYRVVSGADPS